MLAAEGISKHFSGVTALSDVGLRIDPGEIVGLIGPNGSGKSTLLGVLSGFIRADSGRVALEGRRIDRLSSWSVARLGIRRTFQIPAQPRRMSVLETMLLGGDLSAGATIRDSLFRPRLVTREQRRAIERAREILRDLTLLDLEHAPAGSLSGGQQKLLSLGVALMSNPRALLLDEPTAGVHPHVRKTLIGRLRALHRSGTSLVIVEHDMPFIGEVCERVYVLDRGRMVTCCAPSELAQDERVVEAYLGGHGRRARGSRPPAIAATASSTREPDRGEVAS
jgi:branched-chain amino acid transport system ATP-binding protein